MEYTREDVLEMKELLKDNYARCLAFQQEPEVDNIYYTMEGDAIVAKSCVVDANEVVISDIFDRVEPGIFHTRYRLDKIVWEKEVLDTSLLSGRWGNGYRGSEVVAVDCKELMNSNTDKHSGNSTIKALHLQNCEKLGKHALYSYIGLSSLNLTGVKEIGDNALYSCVKIETLDASAVEKLGRGCFKNMSALKTIDLSNADILRTDLFKGCSNLKIVRISGKCKKIEDRAFNGLTGFKHIQFAGTKEQWAKLSKNMANWRGETFAEFKGNKFVVEFVKD